MTPLGSSERNVCRSQDVNNEDQPVFRGIVESSVQLAVVENNDLALHMIQDLISENITGEERNQQQDDWHEYSRSKCAQSDYAQKGGDGMLRSGP